MVSRARLTGVATVALALIVVGTVVLLTRDDDSTSTRGATASDQLAVSLKQYRRDEARRVIQAVVTNKGATPITVSQLRLEAAGFAPGPAKAPDATISAGDRVDLPIQLGEVRCVESASPTAGPATVIAQVQSDDASRELRLPVPQPVELLDRILALECRQRALARAVDIGFGDSWTTGVARGRPALFGSIVINRRPGHQPQPSVAVIDLRGSVIFGLRPIGPRQLPIQLDPAAQALTIPVEFIVERCDGHALAESKRSYFFPLWISLDGADEVYQTIQPDDAARRQLEALIRDACNLDG